MVVIFGWGAGQTSDFGEVAPTTCPVCHNEVFLHHVRSDKSFSLYFIPMATYGSDEYLVCPICHHGLQLDPGKRGAVGTMRAKTHAFRHRMMTLEAYRPLVDRFWRELGVDPVGAQILRPTAAVPPLMDAAQAATSGLAQRLEGLGKLHADGVLTDDEFAAAKRHLLET
jgi:uncharacterized protein YbaR (Trm112 family)